MSFAAPAKYGRKFVRPPSALGDGLRIGLLGGSFNPAHSGHRHISALALKTLRLDYVWWLVSPQNPLKSTQGMAPFDARFAAAQAFAQHPRIVVTDIEGVFGMTYTADTLAALRTRFPRLRFVWLMGTDNLVQFPRWRRWRQILCLTPVAVAARPGTALTARTAKTALYLRGHIALADARFASRRPPGLTLMDAKRDFTSATRLRSSALSPGS